MNEASSSQPNTAVHGSDVPSVGGPSPVGVAAFAAAYVLAAGFGQGVALIPGVAITFWPPAGIFLAMLLANPRRTWPWWIAGGCVAELASNALWFHSPLSLALVYYAANVLTALAAALLVLRFTREPLRLESLEQVAVFTILAAGVAPIASATIIAATDAVIGKHPFGTAWWLVWIGDATGLLVSTPPTLVAVQAWRHRDRISRRRLGEAAVLGALLLALGLLAFGDFLPTTYLLLPVVLWTAARFQLRGVAVVLPLVAVMTAAFTVHGAGGLGGGQASQAEIVSLQVFLGVCAVSALVVAALGAQRQKALEELDAANAMLEGRVKERTAELEQVNAELQQAEAALREADRRKDEFLAVLSHELRNPLAPIVNSLHLLDQARAGGEQAERARQVMRRQVAQLSSLVNDLLDVTRITQGKVRLQRDRLDLAEVVRRTVEDHRTLFEQAGVRIEMAGGEGPVPVHADRTRMTQVVGNLLQNAVKFSTGGGCTRVGVQIEREHAVVRVIDDGVGMSPETLEQIFTPFTQAAQTLDRSQGGLGLGLALVKGLVELHGGDVTARSEGRGRGAEFSVRLPLDAGSAPEAPAATEGEPPSRRRVLIIEDNADAADSLAELLELGGHEVAVAYDGRTGIARAREFRPEVALCDIGLPGLTGYEVARAIRADGELRGVYLVALSGYAQPDDLRRASDAGFHQHLPKPPSLEALEELLATAPRGARPDSPHS